MCYPFTCDNHLDCEVSETLVSCPKHSLMHDPRIRCPECERISHVPSPREVSFDSSWHIERDAVAVL